MLFESYSRDTQTYHRRGEGDTEDYDETLTDIKSDDDVAQTITSTDLEKQSQELLKAQEERELAEKKSMEERKQFQLQQKYTEEMERLKFQNQQYKQKIEAGHQQNSRRATSEQHQDVPQYQLKEEIKDHQYQNVSKYQQNEYKQYQNQNNVQFQYKSPYEVVSADSIDCRDSQLTTDSSGNTQVGIEMKSTFQKSTRPTGTLIFKSDSEFKLISEPQPVSVNSYSKEQAPKVLRPTTICSAGFSTKNYFSEGSLFFPDRESVLVFGGVDPHSKYGVSRNTGKDIYRFHPEANTWEFIGELPHPRHHHSVAFFKDRVFLVGGADPRDDDIKGKSVVMKTVWSYEPVTRTWFKEADMLTPRKNFGLVATDGKLYAIGGQDRQGRVLSSVERYDPKTRVWEDVAPMEVGRMGVAATKFRDMIWVAGGMTASKKSPLCRNVECYDPRHNIWIPYTGLRFPRCFGCLFCMNDTLYLIGGAGRVTERDRATISVGAIDIWDAENKKWCLQSEMTIPRHGHSIAYIGPQILIIGGVTTVYMRALSNVECFCCKRGTWIKCISNLPTTLSGHGSITLPPATLM